MQITKVFKSGNSTAIRFSKEFHLKPGEEVEIVKKGDVIMIQERKKTLADALNSLGTCTDDFFATDRFDLPPQKRDF